MNYSSQSIVIKLTIVVSLLGFAMCGFSQNYFTGELFEAYEWDIESLNTLEMELQYDIVLRRRLLSKKEKALGKVFKENKQFYDEVVIKKNSKPEVIKISDNILKIRFDKKEDFVLMFGPNDEDDENYSVVVNEMKGEKGVTNYQGLPYRVLNGPRLIIGKIKKKKLPPARTTELVSVWEGNGSGLIIDGEGYVVTSYHVIEDANEISIQMPSNDAKDLKAKVVIKDKENDLAILKIVDSAYQPLESIKYSIATENADVGTDVFTLGYPMALAKMGTEVKFTEGSISSKTGYEDDVSNYQISVPVQPGNSGGPLFDYDGNLVGIINAKIVGAAVDNVSYAIKAAYLLTLIDSSKDEITPPKHDMSGMELKSLIKMVDDYVVMIKVK